MMIVVGCGLRPATAPLALTDDRRESLQSMARSGTASHREATRARALLLAGDGLANTAIAARLGVSPASVAAWRARFAEDGLAQVTQVRAGRGRRPSIPAETVEAIVRATLQERPPGETRWSCRTIARTGRESGHGAADLVGPGPGPAPG